MAVAFGVTLSAHAATSPITACDRTADLESMNVAVNELSLELVDHISAKSDREIGKALDMLPPQEHPTPPTLDLAPRAANILEDIFSAVAIETPPLDPHDPASTFEIDSVSDHELPLSPVAGDVGQSESEESSDSESGGEDITTELNVQRQMLRTDI
jgi:hypothetical protein